MDWHVETVDIIALLKIELCAFFAQLNFEPGSSTKMVLVLLSFEMRVFIRR
ncbi:hypothetical protein ABIA49_001091 [Bacillus safensis]